LAVRNSARFPLRSTLTIGLTAAASFLIASLSAFQLATSKAGPQFDSGDGGFALIAQSDQPIYQDLNSATGRNELGFDDSADSFFSPSDQQKAPAQIYPIRVQAGDAASCLNL